MKEKITNPFKNFSRNQIILLSGLLILAIIVVGILGTRKHENKQTNNLGDDPQVELPKYDLYSRQGKVTKIDGNNFTVTFSISEIKNGVAQLVNVDRQVIVDDTTTYFSISGQKLSKSDLKIGKAVTVYSRNNIDYENIVHAQKIDIR